MLLDIAQAGETAGAIVGETSVTRSKFDKGFRAERIIHS